MEGKLSEKATKIRHRLTFTRSSSARGLESTLVSPIEASLPSSRPRSATNPESPIHDEPTWDIRDPDFHGGYSFTDEPGYFRPTSPFIDRQEIEEDLEADIKHACAMLSHSIDRGIPAGLSYRSAVPVWTDGQNPAGQPSVDAAPSSLKQRVILLSAPKPISPETESTKKHDSGVGMSFNSPSQPGRPYGNSVSRTGSSARFYNKQPSASPPHSPSPGIRSRSHSLATTIEEDNQRERSYSTSPVPFPYSPPQFNSEWASKPTTLDSPVSSLNESDRKFEATESELETEPQNENATNNEKKPETSPPAISAQEAPFPGGAGRTWLRASRDLQRLIDEEQARITQANKTKPLTRFYSSYNQTTVSFNSREGQTKNFWEDRDPSFYARLSPASSLGTGRGTVSRPETGNPRLGTASTNGEDLPGGYPYQTFAGSSCGMSYSSSCLGDEFKHQESVYSVAMPGLPVKNNRRKKASILLRKLAGLRIRRKENDNLNGIC
ncbi:hypothetical protein N7471_007376 [Penicillium samsonianum]|uniref:uncharacterized protein n=1 Tax=Penicillium samsonianum TaxID=1882272 RepID=UPI0025496909|nr:uncharacterized protein N7471_007376 [Penicillium samsonianum]KAJ6132161.1 hypothetical protein N7471_007376 [Penicillium samsonianum]